jgi:hypothetical protein
MGSLILTSLISTLSSTTNPSSGPETQVDPEGCEALSTCLQKQESSVFTAENKRVLLALADEFWSSSPR